MSITSLLNPTALVSAVAGRTPVTAAASCAVKSFASTLSQVLHRSGTAPGRSSDFRQESLKK